MRLVPTLGFGFALSWRWLHWKWTNDKYKKGRGLSLEAGPITLALLYGLQPR